MHSPGDDPPADDRPDLFESAAVDLEGTYVCDGCGEEIVIPLDPAEGVGQTYVEDCPVCCRPSVIHVDWDGPLARVWAEPEQDRY